MMQKVFRYCLFLLFTYYLYGNSDTLTLNPVTWETPSPEGWNAQYKVNVDFPESGGPWRQILMIQTLKCDSATKGDKFPCGEWDYIWNTLVEIPDGDSLEVFSLGSFVTPYGKRLKMGGEQGWVWVYDLTDYAPLLKGNKKLTVGNNQELLDLKFIFIPGTPVREVLKVENIYPYGTYKYGALADDSLMAETMISLNPDASGYAIKSVISGHGHAGPHNCCEWDSKTHTWYIDGWQQFRWNVWTDCGNNPIYPQGGTWPFDRAGWCPGTIVDEHLFELTSFITPGDTLMLDYGIEPYGKEGEEDGEFRISHQLFTYGPLNFKTDAEIVDIINPSSKGLHSRVNPNLGPPSILIRNTGSQLLHSLNISYGLKKGRKSTFKWVGELNFMESEEIFLPIPSWRGLTRNQVFSVTVSDPNGTADENPSNDMKESNILIPDQFPEQFILKVQANGLGRARENSFSITEMNGNVLYAQETIMDNETLEIPFSLKRGHYRFHFTDDLEDGISKHWWYRSEPEKIGIDGSVMFLSENGDTLKQFNPDFGQELLYYFQVGSLPR